MSTASTIDYTLIAILVTLLVIKLFVPIDLIVISVAYIASAIVIYNTAKVLIKREFTVDLLAAIALILSLYAQEYNSIIYINLMLAFARIFSRYTADRTHSALSQLIKLRPIFAKRVKENGKIEHIPVAELQVKDIVLVDLGESIPVDGRVIKGNSTVDQSSFTGESVPIEVALGDKVLASTIVTAGALILIADKIGKETSFEKIVELVAKSQKEKPTIETIAGTFAKAYIFAALFAAILLYIITKNTTLVLGILLVVCADDIAVATPLAFMAGIGVAAKHGVIIKGASFLETLSNVKKMVLDKTGTLTRGEMKVTQCIAVGRASMKTVMALSYALSSRSEHPVSKEIANYAQKRGADKPIVVTALSEVKGKGVIATFEGQQVVLGKLLLLQEMNTSISAKDLERIEVLKNSGHSLTFLAYNGNLIAVFLLADQIKKNVHRTILSLKQLGVKPIMLTGDHEVIAAQIAKKAGITSYAANLLPQDKLAEIRRLSEENTPIVMVGDGVNDAPALTLATVGIAMGAMGSDVAINAADIVLMNDDFSKIPYLIHLSQFVITVIKQNIGMWAAFNVIGIALVGAGYLSPAGAAAYNFGMDFVPIFNAMRVFLVKPK
jgi:heavy metal translocating P-type ATPase